MFVDILGYGVHVVYLLVFREILDLCSFRLNVQLLVRVNANTDILRAVLMATTFKRTAKTP